MEKEKKSRCQLNYEMRMKAWSLMNQNFTNPEIVKMLHPLVQDEVSIGHFENSIRSIRGHWTRNHKPRKGR